VSALMSAGFSAVTGRAAQHSLDDSEGGGRRRSSLDDKRKSRMSRSVSQSATHELQMLGVERESHDIRIELSTKDDREQQRDLSTKDGAGGNVIFSAEESDLEPNHTHFLLVDSGHTGSDAWGEELELRFLIEKAYCETRGVPRVMLVVQGGIGTVKSVNRAIKDKCPIVLIADSGGAATVITQFVETYQDERSEYYGYGEIPQTQTKRPRGSSFGPLSRALRIHLPRSCSIPSSVTTPSPAPSG